MVFGGFCLRVVLVIILLIFWIKDANILLVMIGLVLEDVEEEEVLLFVVVVDDLVGVDVVVLGVDVDLDCCCISKEGKYCLSIIYMWIVFERYMLSIFFFLKFIFIWI